jgi:hypothetical protein
VGVGVDEAKGVRRRRDDALARFLAYLVEIESALARRDAMGVTALLRKRTATHMPREVREELLLISRAPRESLRAPVQFLRFQHRMRQLAEGGERLPTAQTELSLEAKRASGTVRRDERVAAARDATDHDAAVSPRSRRSTD